MRGMRVRVSWRGHGHRCGRCRPVLCATGSRGRLQGRRRRLLHGVRCRSLRGSGRSRRCVAPGGSGGHVCLGWGIPQPSHIPSGQGHGCPAGPSGLTEFRQIAGLPGEKFVAVHPDAGQELIRLDQAARGAVVDLAHPAIRGCPHHKDPVLIDGEATQCPEGQGLGCSRHLVDVHAQDLLLVRADSDRARRVRPRSSSGTSSSAYTGSMGIPQGAMPGSVDVWAGFIGST